MPIPSVLIASVIAASTGISDPPATSLTIYSTPNLFPRIPEYSTKSCLRICWRK